MEVKEIVKNHPTGVIARAYHLAEKAHSGQKRKSGEPYFNHLLGTAEILNEWRLDENTIVAGLLHDIVEDTGANLKEIKKEFGEEVAFLVDGLTKLGKIKYRGNETRAENMRKLIIALSRDLRVIFIKLADRLHNMRTLQFLAPPKQKRIAMETDEIYATIAYRLGMQNLSGELRDLAFPFLYPKENKWIQENVREKYEGRLAYLKRIKPILEKNLKENGIEPMVIDFRAKRRSSLYKKLLRYNMDVDKIYDLVAMRIILKTVPECYAALGSIHQLWPPLPGRIKDYIAMPKPNSYRSLHTTVIGPDEKCVEIQIRTEKMHEEDEKGIAAHWLYKTEGILPAAKLKSSEYLEELRWVEQLRSWQDTFRGPDTDPEEFLKAMKVDFFKDRIFAITPKGDVIDLPAGSTPIDFAYHIHSEIGDACVGAKINDSFAPLDAELRSGDVVQIIMQKNKKPSESWTKFVKTSLARGHIKAALRRSKQGLSAKITPSKTELRIVVEDRVGLIKDISGVISRSHVNIISFNTADRPTGKFPVDKIECATTDKKKIEKIILKLKGIKGVKEVGYKLI